MTKLTCDVCGGTLVIDAGGKTATCQFCGMQHSVERVREKMIEIRGSVSIEGNVSVSGVANVEALLTRAQEFFEKDDYDKAREYYERVLDNEPDNLVAREGLKKLHELVNVEVGKTYDGVVTGIEAIRCFVKLMPSNKEGTIFITDLAPTRVESVAKVVSVGDTVKVLVTDIDRNERITLKKV